MNAQPNLGMQVTTFENPMGIDGFEFVEFAAPVANTLEPIFEKRMDGFSIAFHMLSHAKIGTSAVQSRATAGVAGATFIFCLPGSPGACRDAWDGILVHQLDYRYRPCNFVEIMPRLDEHLRRGKART